MPRAKLVAGLVLSLLGLVACERSAGDAARDSRSELAGANGRAAVGGGGLFHVRYTSVPDPIPLNESFELVLEIRRADAREPALRGATVYATGWMPDHGHGMVREAKVVELADGTYRARGMLFHMPGRWELNVDVIEAGISERVSFELELR